MNRIGRVSRRALHRLRRLINPGDVSVNLTATPFFGAWCLMIGMGIWHGSNAAVPTIGYLPTLLILAGLSAIYTGAS